MYAIVQTGTACFCSNQVPPDANHVEDKWCDKPCAGYPFEMCGSTPVDLTVAEGAGVGGGAYANVMLVGSSLASEAVYPPSPPPPPPPPPPSTTPKASVVALPTVSTPAPVSAGNNPKVEGSAPATATVAAAAKGSLHPEIRNDSQPAKDKDDGHDSADDGADEDEENNSDESKSIAILVSG